MRFHLIISLLVLPFGVRAQHLTHREWLVQSFRDMRLAPAFGERIKNADQQASDSLFVTEMLAVNPDHHACAEHLLGLGFELLKKGDMVQAMYRFNHAYLMEPGNAGIRRGYGAFFVALDRPEEAIAEYQKGLAIDSNAVPLLVDLAGVQLSMYHARQGTETQKAMRLLEAATTHIERATRLEPSNGQARYKLAVCHTLRGDCSAAWNAYRACLETDPAVVEEGFDVLIHARCPQYTGPPAR